VVVSVAVVTIVVLAGGSRLLWLWLHGPPPGSMVGVTVDTSGSPVAVIMVCRGHLDGIDFNWEAAEEGRTVGSWRAQKPLQPREFVTLPLLARTTIPGWMTVQTPPSSLPNLPGWGVAGWTTDRTWAAQTLFQRSDLRHLSPDTVRWGYLDSSGGWSGTTSVSDFREHACSHLGR
jgi:hypothetical protein